MMEQAKWLWICFDFHVRFMPYFDKIMNATIKIRNKRQIRVLYYGYKLSIG